MPLQRGKSDKAFSHNIREMMHSGHSQAQSIAAAYSEKRKMAHGGPIDPGESAGTCAAHGMASCQTCTDDDSNNEQAKVVAPADYTSGAYAMGGMVDRIMKKKYPEKEMDTEDGEEAHEPDGPSVEDPEPEDERDDMIGRIMKKRMAAK